MLLMLSHIRYKRSLQTRNQSKCKFTLLRSKCRCPKTIKINFTPSQRTATKPSYVVNRAILFNEAAPCIKTAPHESAHGPSCVAAPYHINQEIASQCQSSSFQIITVEIRRGRIWCAAIGQKSRKLDTRQNPYHRRHHDIEFIVLSYNLRGGEGKC